MSERLKDHLYPTISLLAICLVMTFILVLTHTLTQNIISAGAGSAEENARLEVMEDANDFVLLEGAEVNDESEIVREVYAAYQSDTLIGYVFTTQRNGYSGPVISVVGVEIEGYTISGVRIIQQSETPNLGTLITEPEFYEGLIGKGGEGVTITVVRGDASGEDEVEAISAATYSTEAVIRSANAAIRLAEYLVQEGVGS